MYHSKPEREKREMFRKHLQAMAKGAKPKVKCAPKAGAARATRTKFKALIWWSGPRGPDSLAAALIKEGRRFGFEVEVVERDIKVDPETGNLDGPTALADLEDLAAGEYDIFHGAYPCETFSRATFNEPWKWGIYPCRNRMNTRGIPGQSPEQQQKAETGDKRHEKTLLAATKLIELAVASGAG